MKTLSLKYRIALTIFLLQTLMMAFLLWQTLTASYETSRRYLEQAEVGALQLLHNLGRQALLTRDFDELQAAFEQVGSDPYLKCVALADTSGHVVASTNPEEIGSHLLQRRDSAEYRWRTSTVSDGTSQLGILTMQFSTRELRRAFERIRNIGIATAGAWIGILALVGLVMGLLVTHRLDPLVAAAQRIGSGDFGVSVNVAGNDEVARLGEAFNQMAAELRTHVTQLQASEARYRDLVENINDVVFSMNVDGLLTYVSPRIQDLTGYTPEEIVGHSFTEFIYPDDLAIVVGHFYKVLGGDAQLPDHRVVTKEGKPCWVRVVTRPVRQDGEVVGLQGLISDITERKESEQKLRQARDFYLTLLNDFPMPIWRSGPDTRHNYFNQTWFQFTGRTVEEERGEGWTQGVHPDDRERRWQTYLAAFEAREPFEIEYRLRRHDGQYRWVVDWGRPFKDLDGNFAGYIGAVVDITERKITEEALREREELFRQIFENSPIGINLVDLQGRFLKVNQRMCDFLGYAEEDLVGKPFQAFTHVDDHERDLELTRQLFSDEIPFFKLEKRYVRKNGDVVWGGLTATVIRDEKGHPHFGLGMVEDITERKQMEAALRESEERFRRFSELSVDGINVHEDGKLVDVNRRSAEIFGYDYEELIGMDVLSLTIPEEREKIRARIEQGDETPYETVALRKDGSTLPVEVHPTNLAGEGRNLRVAVIRDLTERKLAEQKITESEALYRALVEQSTDAIYVLQDGYYVLVNRAWEEMFGYSREEALRPDFDFWRIIAPESRELIRERYEARLADLPLEPRYEFKAVAADGRLLDLEVTVIEIMWKGRKAWQGVYHDITERKRAEEALRMSEEKFSKAFHASPDAITISALEDGRFLEVNTGFERLLKYSKEEAIGETSTSLNLWVHPRDRLRMVTTLEKEGSVQNMESMFRAKDGTLLFGLVSAELIDFRGQKCLVAVTRDITERKQAEQALRESEATNRALLEAIPDLMFRIRADGTFLDYRPAQDLATYVPPEEFIDKHLLEVLPSEVAQQAMALMRQALQTGETQTFEYPLEMEGGRGYYEARIVASGENEVLVLVRDISQRKRAEEKMREYQSELRSLASELSLAEERERRRIAEELHDHIAQTLAISKIKLDEAKALAGSSKLAKPLEQVRALIEDAVRKARSLMFEISPPVLYDLGFEAAVEWLAEQFTQQHGIPVSCTSDDRPKPLADDVRIFLFKAVRELLVNVTKHARASKAQVSVRRNGAKLIVTVEDDGVGFEAKTAVQPQVAGGFGLFNIRERLDFHGGKLEIKSKVGRGTRVVLSAPLFRESD